MLEMFYAPKYKIKMNTKEVTCVLYFENNNLESVFISIPFIVKSVKVKQISVVNGPASEVSSMIASLKSDFIKIDEFLCHFPLTPDTSFCLPLNTVFVPSTSIFNNNYSFYLTYSNKEALHFTDLDCWVNITMEFIG